jgi:hypothetical protein
MGRIAASELTTNEVDDGSQVGPLLDQLAGPVASLTGDGAYDQDGVFPSVAQRHPDARVRRARARCRARRLRARPRSGISTCSLLLSTAAWAGRRSAAISARALAEVIGGGLRSRTDQRQVTEMTVAVAVLNRMLKLGRPKSVRIARTQAGIGSLRPPIDPRYTVPTSRQRQKFATSLYLGRGPGSPPGVPGGGSTGIVP